MILKAESAQWRVAGRQKLHEVGPKRLRLSVSSLGWSGEAGSLHGLASRPYRGLWPDRVRATRAGVVPAASGVRARRRLLSSNAGPVRRP